MNQCTSRTNNGISGFCSVEILQKFVEFGKTGMMLHDLATWLDDPKAQYIPPWKPFDNVHFVDVCWAGRDLRRHRFDRYNVHAARKSREANVFLNP